MYLDEYKNKPRNGIFILLKSIGIPRLKEPEKFWTASDITEMICSVYNINTDRVSDKSVYVDNKDRLYIKSNSKRLYLDDFSQ